MNLVREEGVEEPLLGLGVHAAAGVGHFEVDEVAGRRLLGDAAGGQGGLVAVHRARAQGDRSRPVAQGLGGVGDQVHDDLLHLAGVGLDRRQVVAQIELQLGLFGDAGLEQVGVLVDQLAEVDAADEQMPLAGVGQHLPGQVGGPRRGPQRPLDVRQRGRVRRELRWPGRRSRRCSAGC